MITLDPVSFAKALADSTRARIALLLASQGELCVCDLTQALALSQPKISRHLALLRESGLLQDERRGQWIYYQLHPDLPDWAFAVVQLLADGNGQWLAADVARLQASQRCC